MPQVTFHAENQTPVTVNARRGETLLDLAAKNHIPINAPCSGSGKCGKCRVRLLKGNVDASRAEQISEEESADGWCLACQSRVLSDAEVLVPGESLSEFRDISITDLSSAEPVSREDCFGLAIDIGTTTVCAILADLPKKQPVGYGMTGNAQTRFGADVISRILAQQKEGGINRLQKAIVGETLNPLIRALCASAKVQTSQICRVTIAANTTMNHLLLGIDADSIRKEPNVPAFYEKEPFCASEIGLAVSADAEVVLAPNIGSYVGGDITAGTSHCRLQEKEELSLLLDLGTNGELVLGNQEFLVSCACSAGPAFEGGDISCGMRAKEGAIEACEIDPKSMEPAIAVIGGKDQKPAGLCGSGLIDVVSALFTGGIISPRGKFIREGARIRRDAYGMGRYVIAWENESAAGREISINEADIDNFIRAKAAIYAAIRVLLSTLDLRFSDLCSIEIAGGIGSGINIGHAVSVGMLPDLPPERYHYVGNTALAGAYEILLSKEAQADLFELSRGMTYLDLSLEPGYMEEFVAECFLPHTDADFRS